MGFALPLSLFHLPISWVCALKLLPAGALADGLRTAPADGGGLPRRWPAGAAGLGGGRHRRHGPHVPLGIGEPGSPPFAC